MERLVGSHLCVRGGASLRILASFSPASLSMLPSLACSRYMQLRADRRAPSLRGLSAQGAARLRIEGVGSRA